MRFESLSICALSVLKMHRFEGGKTIRNMFVCLVVQCPRYLGFPCGQLPIRRASVCPESLPHKSPNCPIPRSRARAPFALPPYYIIAAAPAIDYSLRTLAHTGCTYLAARLLMYSRYCSQSVAFQAHLYSIALFRSFLVGAKSVN